MRPSSTAKCASSSRRTPSTISSVTTTTTSLEAYIPSTDTFIDLDSIINDQIDRMRHSATVALLSRRDVIIVASVSCIYGIGSAESYHGLVIQLAVGESLRRDTLLRQLVDIQYERNDVDFHRGTFRVRGDVLEIFPTYEHDTAIRIEFFGDDIESIKEVDPLRGRVKSTLERYAIYPGSHYVTPQAQMRRAIESIRTELRERLDFFDKEGRFLEKQRLEQRTLYDLEMMEQMGFCSGIENYSRHLWRRKPGEAPPTLVDYFPPEFLIVIDESHQTMPQLQAMYRGDRARKETLVEYGFRLPSALDNRPLKFEEFEAHVRHAIYVSATPGEYELQKSQGEIVEQLIRPTGLTDPQVEVRPVSGQVDDFGGGDPRTRQKERARARDDAHQAYVGRSHGLLSGARNARPVSPLGHRDARAHRHPARLAARRIRRPGRHQPPSRRARSPRGLSRRDLRRG